MQVWAWWLMSQELEIQPQFMNTSDTSAATSYFLLVPPEIARSSAVFRHIRFCPLACGLASMELCGF